MIATLERTTAPVPRPFVHVFAHEGRWYVYDVNRNALLEVDAVLGRVLEALSGKRPHGEARRLTSRYGSPAVGLALDEIVQARREEDLFLDRRPAIVPRRITGADRGAYETRLSHLILSVTEDCNLACRYCPQATGRARPGSGRPRAMPVEVALRAFAHFAARCQEAASPTVSFYGGEPLLRHDIIAAVVGAARDRRAGPDLRFVVDTNGTLLDDAAADLIARERLHLQISLDGPQRAHDRWRVTARGLGSHARVMAGLRRVLRRDPSAAERIAFQVTVAPPFDLDELAAWFGDFSPYRDLGLARPPRVRLGFADLSRCRLSPRVEHVALRRQMDAARGRWRDARAGGRRGSLDPVARSLFDPEAIRFHHRARGLLPAQFTPGGCCAPGVRRLHALPDGRYEPCERLGARLTIGHVDKGIETERVERLAAAFSRALGERCRDCWAVRLCRACYAALRRGSDGDLVLPAALCEGMRADAEAQMRLYLDLLACGEGAVRFLSTTRLN